MKRKKLMGSMMCSVFLFAACDISNDEIETKAQDYAKAEYGISVKLNRVETHGNGKDFFGPDLRTAYVQQVDEPHVQFQLDFEGNFSPKVKNDNYKVKKQANDVQEKFHTYYEETGDHTRFTFLQIQTGDTVFDKKTEKEIKKKNQKMYVTGVFQSNSFLDLNNSEHMEKLAEVARRVQSFNKTIENNKIVIEDITIFLPNAKQHLLQNIPVDYILTAEYAKQTLEKRHEYRKALQLTK
ncbi:hypothetical protein ACE41A_07020 [Bacillus cytotoxicus]|uniref:hypothetical protein n=1 Tax=Bacillus cytotoxicus TaxID=580165 RepID=UPI0035CC5DA7